MKRVLGIGGVVAVGAALLLASPANATQIDPSTGANTPSVSTAVIHVPSDFDTALSDTRATGHYAVVGTGLRVWTEGSTSTDKVAEYVDTNKPLSAATDTALDFTTATGTIPPGAQLYVDITGDGRPDGILVGEPTFYGQNWWLSTGATDAFKAGSPHVGSGNGSPDYGTLDEWATAFPTAKVDAFGFSLGSEVLGDYTINSIRFAGTTYTFATTKGDCKNGGWAKISDPVYKNQGACVSHFASGK